MFIFIIDFDRTIVNGHTHNTIARFYKTVFGPHQNWSLEEQNEQWDLIKHIPPISSENLSWNKVITTILKNKHQVAIASFSSFPDMIPRYLHQTVGLSEETVAQIYVEAWLPEHPEVDNKNKHIENIARHFKFKDKKSNIILIDDSRINTDAAQSEHYSIIPAHDMNGFPLLNGEHLGAIMHKLSSLSEIT